MNWNYASPEQMNADYICASPLFDSYAAGIVLYQMITGKLPFEDYDYEKTSILKKSNYPPNIPEIKNEINELIRDMVAPDPNKRLSIPQIFQKY